MFASAGTFNGLDVEKPSKPVTFNPSLMGLLVRSEPMGPFRPEINILSISGLIDFVYYNFGMS